MGRKGSENLIPLNKRTMEERRIIATKGGKASVKSRQKKRMLKDCMIELLKLPVTDKANREKLIELGIREGEIDNRMLLTTALFARAVEMGDVAAFKEIRDLIGESEKIEEVTDNGLVSSLEKISQGIDIDGMDISEPEAIGGNELVDDEE